MRKDDNKIKFVRDDRHERQREMTKKKTFETLICLDTYLFKINPIEARLWLLKNVCTLAKRNYSNQTYKISINKIIKFIVYCIKKMRTQIKMKIT